MTYKEASEMIIAAYFADQINVNNAEFCFCGTLCGNSERWAFPLPGEELPYSYDEYGRMEAALFSVFDVKWVCNGTIKILTPYRMHNFDQCRWFDRFLTTQKGEQKVFEGMCAALDVLKQIHIERGEVIDEVPEFKQRPVLLATTN